MHRRWYLLAVASLALILPACSQSSGKTKVAFVSNNPEAFWTIAEAGCRAAEKDFDVEVIFRKPAQGDVSVQKEIIDTLLSRGVQGMAISVIDPKNQKLHLDEVAARIPLICQDNDAPESKRLCYIGTNNYEAGRAAGKLVKQAMPDGGVIAVFVGQMEPLNARQRRQGVLDELADRPPPSNLNDFPVSPDGETFGKYRLHKTYTEQPVGQQRAKENATDALTQLAGEPNLCLVGLWAYNPPAMLSAVKDRKLEGKVKIVGFDEDFATLQGVIDGHIHGTIVQDPYNFGYQSIKLLTALAKGDKSVLPQDGILFVPHKVITQSGGDGAMPAAEFQANLKKLLGQ